MAPRSQVIMEDTVYEPSENFAVIEHPKGFSSIRDESTKPFVNPNRPPGVDAEEVNKRLNLNLGQKIIDPNNKLLLWVVSFCTTIFFSWWEQFFFAWWQSIPLSKRRNLLYAAWHVYFPFHRKVLGRRTAIHPDASEEYHAYTTIMWWVRLLPVTIPRVRFALAELATCHPTDITLKVTKVDEPVEVNAPESQKAHSHVQGLLINAGAAPSEYIIFWALGGAFVGGAPECNLGVAELVAKRCGLDIFIVGHRHVPEAYVDDILWDVFLAYRWLSQRHDPAKIIIKATSSGAGLTVRLMQSIAEKKRGERIFPSLLEPLVPDTLPACAVLVGPFVDLTEPKGSLVAFGKHDLVVSQPVVAALVPYLETHVRGANREYSPLYRSFQGLPPMCVAVSEHEAVYDQTIELVNKARGENVKVVLAMWKYMCHVYHLVPGLIPEGEDTINFISDWIRKEVEKLS